MASILTAHLGQTWTATATSPSTVAVAANGAISGVVGNGTNTVLVVAPSAYGTRNQQAIWTLDPTAASYDATVARYLEMTDAAGWKLSARLDPPARRSLGAYQKVTMSLFNPSAGLQGVADSSPSGPLASCDAITDIQLGHVNAGAIPNAGFPAYDTCAFRLSLDNQATWSAWYMCGGADAGANWDAMTPQVAIGPNVGGYPASTSRILALNGVAAAPVATARVGASVGRVARTLVTMGRRDLRARLSDRPAVRLLLGPLNNATIPVPPTPPAGGRVLVRSVIDS